MADRIQQRRDTAARWAQYNPVLLEGEVGYVTDNPNQYKIGDGVHSWNNLPLRGYTGTIVQELGDNENAVMSQKATSTKFTEVIGQFFIYNGYRINISGNIESTSSSSIACTDFLPITRTEPIICVGLWGYTTISPLAYYDKDKNFISAITGTDDVNLNIEVSNIPPNAYYIRCTANLNRNGEHVVKSGVSMASVIYNINNVEDKINNVEDKIKLNTSKISELNEESFAESLYTGIPYVMRNTEFNRAQNKYVDSTGWDALHVKLDEGSTFVVENPDNVNIVSYTWYSTLKPSADSYLGAGSTKREGAKLCIINIRYYTSTLQNYLNFRVIQSSTSSNINSISKITSLIEEISNNELATSLYTGIPYVIRGYSGSSHGIEKTNGWDALLFKVDEEILFDIQNPDNVNIASRCWYNSLTPSEESFINSSSTKPAGAKLCILNERHYTSDETDYRNFRVIQESTFINKASEIYTKLLKVTINNATILVRTSLNQTEDIIIKYEKGRNDQFTWSATYLGNKYETDTAILLNKIHELGDSTGPLGTTDYAPWHMWANHGYCIPCVTIQNNPLTDGDIGAKWVDQTGEREYTIGKIDGNNVYLLPSVRSTDIPNVYTRDWKSPTANNNPQITRLIYKSGGIYTGDIIPSSWRDTQIYPFMINKRRIFTADGEIISGNGVYHCDDFSIKEIFDCTDPWTITTFFPSIIQEDTGAELTHSYNIHGLACRYDIVLNMKKPYQFSHFCGNQVRHLAPISTLDGYIAYGMMPRTKREFNGSRIDIPYNISNLNRGFEFAVRRSEDLYDVDKIPDRFISWLQKESDKKIGCASGFSLTKGETTDIKRKEHIPIYGSGYEDCISCSASLTNKVYLKAIVKDTFENDVLPASFICCISSYLSYFNPNENIGQVYWYKDTDGYVVYAHYQEAHNKVEVNLPTEMDGLSTTVIDKTTGVELLTDFVENGKLYLNVDSSDHNYIVMKLMN